LERAYGITELLQSASERGKPGDSNAGGQGGTQTASPDRRRPFSLYYIVSFEGG
jgi:hypothetical protein